MLLSPQLSTLWRVSPQDGAEWELLGGHSELADVMG
jgi:hypothetical protein